jgi:hypothetical protein
MTKFLLTALLWIAAFFICVWLIPMTETEFEPTKAPTGHGADLLLHGWRGEITALEWTGTKYKVMWRRT